MTRSKPIEIAGFRFAIILAALVFQTARLHARAPGPLIATETGRMAGSDPSSGESLAVAVDIRNDGREPLKVTRAEAFLARQGDSRSRWER